MKLAPRWIRLGRGLRDLVFPPHCVSCGGAVEQSGFRHLCVHCAGLLEYVGDRPACSSCGHPYYGELAGERLCPHCVSLAPAYREGRTAVVLRGPARAIVHELKYRRGLYLVRDIRVIFRRSRRLLDSVKGATLVPVPLHPRKQRERGYNQSELLARCLAEVAGGSTRVQAILKRVADTPSQTTFDRRARQSNLKNAFALLPGVAISPDSHYILVDDVFTTGSTLNSCALVLRRAGCLNLDVVTFGHG